MRYGEQDRDIRFDAYDVSGHEQQVLGLVAGRFPQTDLDHGPIHSSGDLPANHQPVQDFVGNAVGAGHRVQDAEFLTDRQRVASRPIHHPGHHDAGRITAFDGDDIAILQLLGSKLGLRRRSQVDLTPVACGVGTF
jgi:hypothetical protein